MRQAALVFTVLALIQRSISLLLLPLVTRTMSPDDYGAVSLVTVAGTLLGAMLGGPVEQAVFRTASRLEREPSQIGILAAARAWFLLVVPIGSLALAICLFFADTDVFQVSTKLWAIELFAAGMGLYGSSYVQSRLRAQWRIPPLIVFVSVTIVVALVSKLVLVVVFPLGVWGWVISDAISGVTSFAIALLILPKVMTIRLPYSSEVRSLVSFSAPLLPHTTAFWGLSFINRPILAILLPLSDVGYMSIAQNVANVGVLIVAELNRALTPVYAREELPAPSAALARITRTQWIAGVVVSIAIALATYPFIGWVLGDGYGEVGPLLAILSSVPALWTVYAVALNFPTQTLGRTRWNWLASLAGLIVTVLGTLLLVPAVGVPGAAASVLLSWCTMAVTARFVLKLSSASVDWRGTGLTPTTSLLAAICLTSATVAASGLLGAASVLPGYTVSAISGAMFTWIMWRSRPPVNEPPRTSPAE